jgi:hypothetical protein
MIIAGFMMSRFNIIEDMNDKPMAICANWGTVGRSPAYNCQTEVIDKGRQINALRMKRICEQGALTLR